MDRSRKVIHDTIEKELSINGTKVDKETYDLYILFKKTKNDRPDDKDQSFQNFKDNYLNKLDGYKKEREIIVNFRGLLSIKILLVLEYDF